MTLAPRAPLALPATCPPGDDSAMLGTLFVTDHVRSLPSALKCESPRGSSLRNSQVSPSALRQPSAPAAACSRGPFVLKRLLSGGAGVPATPQVPGSVGGTRSPDLLSSPYTPDRWSDPLN